MIFVRLVCAPHNIAYKICDDQHASRVLRENQVQVQSEHKYIFVCIFYSNKSTGFRACVYKIYKVFYFLFFILLFWPHLYIHISGVSDDDVFGLGLYSFVAVRLFFCILVGLVMCNRTYPRCTQSLLHIILYNCRLQKRNACKQSIIVKKNILFGGVGNVK